MKYKYILFDLDGTLIDTNQLIIDSFRHTYKCHLNIEVEEEELLKYFGEPLLVTLKRACEEKAQDMYNTYIDFNEKKHDTSVKIFPGIPQCLAELKALGYTLAVVTSKRKKVALRGLELFDILKHFTAIIALDDTDSHKPEPGPILKALEVLGANAEEALMVGDSIFDIACAKGAGVKSVLVKWSMARGHQDNAHQEQALEADYVINAANELINILQ